MIKKGTHQLTSLDAWLKHAGPRSPIHWQDDRSAKESARAWLASPAGEIPQELREALLTQSDFSPILDWTAEPEALVSFDSYSGPANVDVLLIAQDLSGPFVVAIEAKADETFGGCLADTMIRAERRKAKHPTSRGVNRVQELTRSILGVPPEQLTPVGHLRYQLVTVTAAALAEAGRRSCKRAVVMVHEFVTERTSDDRHRSNAADLDSFASQVSTGTVTKVPTGATCGPFFVPGSGIIDSRVGLYLGKAVRDLRHGGSRRQS